MKLVLTHTPAQAKTLTDVLDEGWRVEPCYGMVRDLPTNELGIEIENDFRPTLTIASGKSNHVRRLMKAIRDCEAVYAATPPPLEGEAMAWHVLVLSPDAQDKQIYRVTLPALNPDAIRVAFAVPRPLDMKMIEAHMTCRIVERLVNWSVNAQARTALTDKFALTWDGIIALRLLADRESVIAAFTLQTAWRASVALEHDGVRFTADVLNTHGAPLTMRNEEQARQLETLLTHGKYWVDKTGQTVKAIPAPGALTLMQLVEIAARDLALPPDRVVALVGTLYEAGWITHPDSDVPGSLSEAAQAYIRREYGTEYLDTAASITVGIAPAVVNRVPEALPGDGAALYALVWKHFIAAHMTPAQERIPGARILVGATVGNPYPLELRATAAHSYFDGWRRVLPLFQTDDPTLPHLTQGSTPRFVQVVVETISNESPHGFTRTGLVGALTDTGMTVADAMSAVESLLTAEYVSGDEALALTERGRAVCVWLTETFGELTSPTYSAELHSDIAQIASGERERIDVLRAFWSRFGKGLKPVSNVVDGSMPVVPHKPITLRPVEEV